MQDGSHNNSHTRTPVYDSLIRISNVGDRRKKGTLTSDRDQIEANLRAIRKLGGRLGRTFEAYNESGATIFAGDKWREALDRVKRGESNGVSVAYIDRFGRDVEGAYVYAAQLHRAGGVLIIDGRPLDPDDPHDKAAFGMGMVLAEQGYAIARQRSLATRERLRERGVTSRVAYGYMRNRQHDGTLVRVDADPKTLVPHPDDAPVVARIFAMRSAGARWQTVADALEADAIASPSGKPMWVMSTLSSIVRNRTYLGEVTVGDFRIEGAHEPLIDHDRFERTQPGSQLVRTGRNIAGVAGGIIVCASCGRPLSVSGRGTGKSTFYACRRRWAGGRCPRPVTGDQRSIDDTVDTELHQRAEGSIDVEPILMQREIGDARADLDLAQRDMNRFVSATAGLPEDRIRAGVLAHNAAIDEAVARLERAEDAAVGLADFPLSGDEWGRLSVAEKRHAARGVIERIELAPFPAGAAKRDSVAGDRVTITWRSF